MAATACSGHCDMLDGVPESVVLGAEAFERTSLVSGLVTALGFLTAFTVSRAGA